MSFEELDTTTATLERNKGILDKDVEVVREAVKAATTALVKKKAKKDETKAEIIRVKQEEEQENRSTERIGPERRDHAQFKEPIGTPPSTIPMVFTALQAKNWEEET